MTKQPIFYTENENEYRSASGLMAWPDWPWPPQVLRQIYATVDKCVGVELAVDHPGRGDQNGDEAPFP